MSGSKQEIRHDEKQNIKEKEDVLENIEKNDSSVNEKKETETDLSKWTPVWDDNAQAYYWWNTDTNKTTWINPSAPAEACTEENSSASAAATSTTTTASNNPLDFLLDRIDNVVKKKLDGGQDENTPYYNNITTTAAASYDQYFDPNLAAASSGESYTSHAHFNARTGRFTTQADVNRLNPEMLSIESRATRQMQNYFDVDSYTEQRNAQLNMAQNGRVNKKKPLTRKEVEYFKRMKKEKKSKRAREWLLQ
ncbi:hypothetical protein [Parasitella parasitica]|uniref:WW domain-containing protein n=1 Tax=Parasitella parasitica TaxID=35722 RepID=A0A0B7N9Y9_9FUNG|nr:hypothetical protein [Parasitella parasitica]